MVKVTKKLGLLLVGIFILGVVIGGAYNFGQIKAASTTPGTIDDPLVSKSYVDSVVASVEGPDVATITAQVLATIDTTTVTDSTPQVSEGTSSIFEVVFVSAGQTIIGNESTEIILRSGAAKAIANMDGNGLSDVTSGVDIGQDVSVSLNHLLIVPRSDGRGLKVSADAYLMVKGTYVIQ
ncbi:MAG: hypothetical protein PF505_03070 [Vallitaleaceae bacterium]|jgi:hypothetical protein|nr:hypothetical protein [Vallitaleaceae bacterium]